MAPWSQHKNFQVLLQKLLEGVVMEQSMLDSGHVSAVKWLREGIAKGRKEFAREVKKLGNISIIMPEKYA
ncbi:putative inactive receptor kinase [Prunus yedoensis var. nudiflora]|uniref:Putative inactive receptor kinase n=1 Tax=Prunus yedoensis var. nudiflora TaxID=2094558 RepID=A0A314XLR9_PRUYE|nr:putative inactive receptor kinase [Prunus yedoensis var. nudiflora]